MQTNLAALVAADSTDAGKEAAKNRAAERKAAIELTLTRLPLDLGRSRILSAAESAAFWGVSLPHWRRLYRAGKVPLPVKVGERKLGWPVGALADGVAAREAA